MCQSHTGRLTGLWFLPKPAFGLNTNNNNNNYNSKLCYQTVLTLDHVLKNYYAHFVCLYKCVYSAKWLLREGVGLAQAEETFVRNWAESQMLTYNPHILWGFKSICHTVLSSSFLKLFILCILNQYFHLIYQLNAPTIYVYVKLWSLHSVMFWHDSGAILYYNKIHIFYLYKKWY